jgi:hypothetical protein
MFFPQKSQRMLGNIILGVYMERGIVLVVQQIAESMNRHGNTTKSKVFLEI